MKKIDAFNHIFPKGFYEKMMEVAGGMKDMGKRVRGVPMLVDLDERFRVMDRFGPDYVQILSLASPPLEVMAGPNATPELAKRANDGMAELCRKYPARFPGFIASLPMNNPEAAVAEIEREVLELGARGVHVVHLEGDRVRVRLELEPEGVRLHDRDGQVAGLELAGGHAPPPLALLQAQNVAVERRRGVEVLRRDGDEVGTGDH